MAPRQEDPHKKKYMEMKKRKMKRMMDLDSMVVQEEEGEQGLRLYLRDLVANDEDEG